LKEYREVTVRQVTVQAETETATVENTETRVDNTTTPKTYTVKKGDSLWNIAKALYGSGADYTKIYEANKGTIGGNPNLIYAGQVLTIP
jgi:nucleoid-associated protein YgaU